MNLVNRFTRAGVNGKQIVCPHCNNNARVFHFAWCALTCQVCHKSIDKYEWGVTVH
jgi:ribosomal protein S27E